MFEHEMALYTRAMDYRKDLQRLIEDNSKEHDKAAMLLSGGALGVSFTYLKEAAGPPPYVDGYLVTLAWVCWALSVTSCLLSFAFAREALVKAKDELDEDWRKPPAASNWMNDATRTFNWSSSILFLLGAASMIGFVNLHQ